MAKFNKSMLKWIIPVVILLLAGGGTAVWFFRPQWIPFLQEKQVASTKKVEGAPDRIFTVTRSDMAIGVMLKGSVNAKMKHKLALEAPFATKLVRVVDENAKVKKGDIVAEFETADLIMKIDDIKLNIDKLKKDLELVYEERAVLVSTNAADMRTAKDNMTEAQEAYSRYYRLEGPKDRDNKDLAVSNASSASETAKSLLSRSFGPSRR